MDNLLANPISIIAHVSFFDKDIGLIQTLRARVSIAFVEKDRSFACFQAFFILVDFVDIKEDLALGVLKSNTRLIDNIRRLTFLPVGDTAVGRRIQQFYGLIAIGFDRRLADGEVDIFRLGRGCCAS